jgi:hypothetical protein
VRKLFKLKSWYTLEEAAARLSLTLSEPISEGDVIQLATEGHIKACWFLNGDHFGWKVTLFCNYPREDYPSIYSERDYDNDGHACGLSLSGPYLLPMEVCPSWGWWLLTFVGKGGESSDWCGAVVAGEDGAFWRLYEMGCPDSLEFFHFPKKSEVVILSKDIEEFELRVRDDDIAGDVKSSPQLNLAYTPANGIDKQQAITAFDHLISIELKKALEDKPDWIATACLQNGTPGGKHKTIWSPVLLAICLRDRFGTSQQKLNSAFMEHSFLRGWTEEWAEKGNY